MKVVELQTLQNGAVIDLFNEEIRKVLDNIDDENTDPKKTREVIIKLVIKPDKTRRTAETKLEIKSKLAPLKPQESFMFFDRQNGELVAFEDSPGPELPGINESNIINVFKDVEGGRKI